MLKILLDKQLMMIVPHKIHTEIPLAVDECKPMKPHHKSVIILSLILRINTNAQCTADNGLR